MPRPFLTAEWRRLGLITYDLDPDALTPLLPPGCEPDTLNGRAFVSFVLFDFLNTRVLGVRWPGFVNFPEINLRFYVRCGGSRGVCFLRELVPSRLIALIARVVYNEPYIATAMSSRFERDATHITTEHRFCLGGRWHTARVRGEDRPVRPPEGSIEHFFKEHSWGFGQSRPGVLRRYRVDHPVWDVFPNAQAEIDVDFGMVYGQAWAHLTGRQPYAVTFAAGSEISVFPHADAVE